MQFIEIHIDTNINGLGMSCLLPACVFHMNMDHENYMRFNEASVHPQYWMNYYKCQGYSDTPNYVYVHILSDQSSYRMTHIPITVICSLHTVYVLTHIQIMFITKWLLTHNTVM